MDRRPEGIGYREVAREMVEFAGQVGIRAARTARVIIDELAPLIVRSETSSTNKELDSDYNVPEAQPEQLAQVIQFPARKDHSTLLRTSRT